VKQRTRFLAAAAVLVGVVAYLAVTGMRQSMTYYYTPAELVARVAEDPGLHDLGARVGGRVAPGSARFDVRNLDLSFVLVDIEEGSASFPVRYSGPLPDTFEEGRDVVVEGIFGRDGSFEATSVLTKCGSRYEAADEDFRA
jgi:cytochrome c-type biogenesis protein CcmE